jgi:hypothetical protein
LIRTFLLAGASALALGATAAEASTVVFTTPGSTTWAAPSTGDYVIDAWGASGGTSSFLYSSTSGGLGAESAAKFHLTAGQVLTIVVGAAGTSYFGRAGGGGGGSGAFSSGYGILDAAGGGGGGAFYGSKGGPGQVPISGQDGYGSAGGAGGSGGGSGGDGSDGSTPGSGGGGHGLFTGMGGGSSGFNGGGGGGGVSGGGGGDGNNFNIFGYGGGGGGGGSDIEGGDTVVQQSGVWTGDGKVLIASVPEPGTWSLMISGLGLLGYALRRRMGRLVRS